MNIEEYEKMYALEDTYWWFQGRKHIIFSLLERAGVFHPDTEGRPPLALDVGCGTGLVLEHLRACSRPLGLDFSTLALSYCRRRGIADLVRSEADCLPVADATADVALALDLLEHIEDDAAVIAEMARVLKPGGHAVVAVPAHRFLWSEHDEALHHCRRYGRPDLRRLIAETPFETVRLTYAISFTFVPIVLYRLATRPFKRGDKPKTHVILLPRAANSLLIRFLRLEARLMRWIDLPFGVSLLALLRKPVA